LLPALGRAKLKAQGIYCINNLKQLQLGWLTYSQDSGDRVVQTGGTDWAPATPYTDNYQSGQQYANWVLGRVDYGTASLNLDWIRNGLLWPYIRSFPVYKCPADFRTINYPSTSGGRTIRSMSMNGWMHPINNGAPYLSSGQFLVYKKQSDIRNPSDIWVTVDESPGTINDGWFIEDLGNGYNDTWIDIPATYHGKAGGLSFADGHAIIKKWTDPVILKNPPPSNFTKATAGNNDLPWFLSVTTVHK
jgi:hypothetical protein